MNKQKIINQIKETKKYGIKLTYYYNGKGMIKCDKTKELETFKLLRSFGAKPYNTKLNFDGTKSIDFKI